MTDDVTTDGTPKPLKGWEHYAKAAELAATAGLIYQRAQDASQRRGGLAPDAHAGMFREMHSVAALAQVHATLATAPLSGNPPTAAGAAGLAPKGYQCPACMHSTATHRGHGCDVRGCDCPQPFGRITPGDPDPEATR